MQQTWASTWCELAIKNCKTRERERNISKMVNQAGTRFNLGGRIPYSTNPLASAASLARATRLWWPGHPGHQRKAWAPMFQWWYRCAPSWGALIQPLRGVLVRSRLVELVRWGLWMCPAVGTSTDPLRTLADLTLTPSSRLPRHTNHWYIPQPRTNYGPTITVLSSEHII